MVRGCGGFLGISDEPRFGPLVDRLGSRFGPLKTYRRLALSQIGNLDSGLRVVLRNDRWGVSQPIAHVLHWERIEQLGFSARPKVIDQFRPLLHSCQFDHPKDRCPQVGRTILDERKNPLAQGDVDSRANQLG